MLLARPRILAALAVIVTPLAMIAFSWIGEIHRSTELDPLIAEAASRHQLPVSLVRAVVWRESDFEVRATGKAAKAQTRRRESVALRQYFFQPCHTHAVTP